MKSLAVIVADKKKTAPNGPLFTFVTVIDPPEQVISPKRMNER